MRPVLLLNYPPPEIQLANIPFDALAFELPPEPLLPESLLADPPLAQRLRSVAQAADRPIAALVSVAAHEVLAEEARKTWLSNLIRIAAQLEADQVQICPSIWWPRPIATLGESERLERVADGLRGIQSLAEDWAVDVVLDLAYTGILSTSPEAAAFIDALAAAPFGVAIDCTAPPAQANPTDWLLTLSHRIRSVRGIVQHPQAENFKSLLSHPNDETLLLVEPQAVVNVQPSQDVLKEAP